MKHFSGSRLETNLQYFQLSLALCHTNAKQKTFACYQTCYTILSQASANPPILTFLWFFEVLRVTTHHAKILRSESKGRSAELT